MEPAGYAHGLHADCWQDKGMYFIFVPVPYTSLDADFTHWIIRDSFAWGLLMGRNSTTTKFFYDRVHSGARWLRKHALYML